MFEKLREKCDITWEKFEEKKNREHEERMRETTVLDKQLSEHPYADHIPHTLMAGSQRQCRDQISKQMQWMVVVGFIFGCTVPMMTHGMNSNVRIRRRYGYKWAAIMSIATIPYVYIVCPVCQWPNSGELQVMTWEQRYKNYIDQKYHLYDDAQEKFYNTLVRTKREKELMAALGPMERDRVK